MSEGMSLGLMFFHIAPSSCVLNKRSFAGPPAAQPLNGSLKYICSATGRANRLQLFPPSDVLNKVPMLKLEPLACLTEIHPVFESNQPISALSAYEATSPDSKSDRACVSHDEPPSSV